MGKSSRLCLEDVRAAFRLVGECRDLRHDPAAWRTHSLEGIGRQLDAAMGNGGEIRWPDRRGPIELIQGVETNFTPKQLSLYGEFLRDHGPNNPLIHDALKRLVGSVATQSRAKLFDPRAWNRAEFQGLLIECKIGHNLISFCDQETPGGIDAIILHREAGRRDFSERDRNLMHLYHEELGRLIGPVLATAVDGSILLRLSPRLRETLDRLLAGDSEKEVARRLGLKRPTIHEYVTELYRRLGVSSRAELLARFLR
jgi:DNA-binding CsgD family transcriptional regulator